MGVIGAIEKGRAYFIYPPPHIARVEFVVDKGDKECKSFLIPFMRSFSRYS